MKLVLLRHGESEWNLKNLFTGWTDVPLTDTGRREAVQAGQLMREAGLDFDMCFTSSLKRAIHTLNLALEAMDRDWLPVEKSWKLNERHYGALQGLDKAATAQRYGEEQVLVWRRSFSVRPPALEAGDERNPARQAAYRAIAPQELPLCESLEDTIHRVIPYYEQVIRPRMAQGQRVLIAAHGNSLRALVMHLQGLTPEAIMALNLPTGVPLVVELDAQGAFVSSAYLGDAQAIAAKVAQVANQGKATASNKQGEEHA